MKNDIDFTMSPENRNEHIFPQLTRLERELSML